MLSYRHAFHAGNHADILKHFVLTELIAYLNQKPQPYWMIDTHAGAGIYDLSCDFAQKNHEFESGISRLIQAHKNQQCPEPFIPMLERIQAMNVPGECQFYPGSAGIAHQMLRNNDRLILCERHPTEFEFLSQTFPANPRRLALRHEDGFLALKALLPPQPRRALVLIDPSYEVKTDYAQVEKSIEDAMKRFATGTYAIWYPLVARREAQQLPSALTSLSGGRWLHVSMWVEPPYSRLGLYGSGLFIINPPWTLPSTLQSVMPWLTSTLAQKPGADFLLEYDIP